MLPFLNSYILISSRFDSSICRWVGTQTLSCLNKTSCNYFLSSRKTWQHQQHRCRPSTNANTAAKKPHRPPKSDFARDATPSDIAASPVKRPTGSLPKPIKTLATIAVQPDFGCQNHCMKVINSIAFRDRNRMGRKALQFLLLQSHRHLHRRRHHNPFLWIFVEKMVRPILKSRPKTVPGRMRALFN